MSGPRFTDRVVNMSLKNNKIFSTLIVAVVAVLAAWWLWNYYMQSPWTRDGKNPRGTGQRRGFLAALSNSISKDNQFVNARGRSLCRDKTPFHIAELNAQAQLVKRSRSGKSELMKPIDVDIYRVTLHLC